MLTFTATVNGKTHGDMIRGLEEALSKARQGFTSGFDRNEDGDYVFDVSGTETAPREYTIRGYASQEDYQARNFNDEGEIHTSSDDAEAAGLQLLKEGVYSVIKIQSTDLEESTTYELDAEAGKLKQVNL